MKNNFKSKKGFTLVETLVAIGILSLSVLATFGAVQNSLQNSGLTKDRTTAFYLIQEGMEYVKNTRDSNALKYIGGYSSTWLTGMSDFGDPCYFGSKCQLDVNATPSITNCPSNVCSQLRIDPTTGAYGFDSSWTPTTYTREIEFTSINSNEVRVTITISWVNRGQNKSVQVTQLLYAR